MTDAINVKTATTAALLAFFNANTGGAQVTKFKDHATAETRVSKLLAEMVADGDLEASEVLAVKAPKVPKEPKVPKVPKEPKAPKVAKEPKVKAVKEPKAPKMLFITELGLGDCGVKMSTFRGQILQTIRDAGTAGANKAQVVAKHALYTADVVCKFKRLGFITEA